jgi:phosphopentomutase
MARAVVLMLDSLGIGASVDADRFGDDGADTFGHIAMACARGDADRPGARSGALVVPNLSALGLVHAAANSRGQWPDGLPVVTPVGAWGYAVESSRGKDTPSGHWEMAGLPVEFDWGYFPNTVPCFPSQLIDRLIAEGNLPGVLGNCHASGTAIIDELGEEHIASGAPIVYTSADSVFQIAAHEKYFGLDKLYALCTLARGLVDEWQIGRVIARPFTGSRKGAFQRTGNRRDYTTPPHGPTLLDRLMEDGGEVISVGKVADIFAGRGISKTIKAHGNQELFDATLDVLATAHDHTLIFTNFVDFDMLYGHRRDVTGYALALEVFDRRLPELQACLKTDDLVLATADHGCDPTYPGHDHTREHVPVLVSGPRCCPVELGERQGFADMGQTLAAYFGLNPLNNGTSFLKQITLESPS